MPRPRYRTKKELVEVITARQDAIIGNTILETGIVDSLVPLSGMDGKITGMTKDGTVTIEFSGPIQAYLDLLTRKKLAAIVDEMELERS